MWKLFRGFIGGCRFRRLAIESSYMTLLMLVGRGGVNYLWVGCCDMVLQSKKSKSMDPMDPTNILQDKQDIFGDILPIFIKTNLRNDSRMRFNMPTQMVRT